MAMPYVDRFNSFLRGEMAAVEAYRVALGRVKDELVKVQLEECIHSHQRRVDMIRTRIHQIGGLPTESSGVWGLFTKTAELGAEVFGQKLAIDLLEQGENFGVRDYERHLEGLDRDSRAFVEQELLRAQRETCRTMGSIRHSMIH
jgi:hypothetical protein